MIPPCSAALFPELNERAATEAALTQQLLEALSTVRSGGVSPTIDVGGFRARLAGMDFAAPSPMNAVLHWVIDSLTEGLVHTTHPGYLGLFNPAPTFAAECADRIAAAFNPQICVWSHAPVAVDIESHTIRQVAARAGMPAATGGHFTSGGSEANNTAVLCALSRANPDFGTAGARAFAGQPRIYASRESHLAWLKIAHQSGIGREAVCLVATDGQGRMSASALREMIAADLANGAVPVMIAATAGTTNAGMVDPLRDCAAIADANGLWLHVDAAWGGALIASGRLRGALDGIALADSLTIDAHKWFATTMGAGMFITPHTALLQQVFRVSTSYMPSNDASVDSYANSMQWSRRFVGLRLFLSLAVAGWAGYAQHVERGVALIDRLGARLTAHGWRRHNNSQMAVACLTPPADSPPVEAIATAVTEAGSHWISVTRFEGTPVLRACLTNGQTTEREIDSLSARLVALAAGDDREQR